jgi:hypothetical protein
LINEKDDIMELKIKLIMVVCFFAILSISLTEAQADEFKAEGLTKPVKKGSRKYAVKVTFPHADFYMDFSPPRACYYTPEGIVGVKSYLTGMRSCGLRGKVPLVRLYVFGEF